MSALYLICSFIAMKCVYIVSLLSVAWFQVPLISCDCFESFFQSVKVARYSFSRPIPPKFEHKLRRHKQSFGKIATTVVLDKDENLL